MGDGRPIEKGQLCVTSRSPDRLAIAEATPFVPLLVAIDNTHFHILPVLSSLPRAAYGYLVGLPIGDLMSGFHAYV